MKRLTANLLFGSAALVCAGFAALQAVTLSENQRINAAIKKLQDQPLAEKLPALELDTPRVNLARAIAIARRDQIDLATEAYNKVINQRHSTETARAALFNLEISTCVMQADRLTLLRPAHAPKLSWPNSDIVTCWRLTPMTGTPDLILRGRSDWRRRQTALGLKLIR